MRNLDLVKFVGGLHEYIGKAVAPVADLVRSLRSDFDAYREAQDARWQKAIDDLASLEKQFPLEPIEPLQPYDPTEVHAALIAEVKALDEAEAEKWRGWVDVRLAAELAAFAEASPKPIGAEEVQRIASKVFVDAREAHPGITIEQVQAEAQSEVAKSIDRLAIVSPADLAKAISEIPPTIVPTAEEIAALIQVPEPIPGDPGKSFTLEEVKALVTEAIESTQAKWELAFERRAQDTLQRACDRLPTPKDGIDGLGFDDMRIEHDGERKFAVIFEKGDRVKRLDFTIPAIIDRGFFIRGETKGCEPGDGYTFGGSYWVCQVATDAEPSVENKDWRLAVRKGRDAREVKFAPKKETGPVKINGTGE